MREIVDNKMDYQTENELLQAECERLKAELAQAVADKKNALACLTKECQDDDMMDCLASENEILKAELAQAKTALTPTIDLLSNGRVNRCQLGEHMASMVFLPKDMVDDLVARLRSLTGGRKS